MLYAINNDTIFSQAVESVIADLRQIISHRIQSHFNQNQFQFDKYIADNFNGNLIKEDIVKHLPQLQLSAEWIVLVTTLLPHLQPNFFESIIAEQLPNGGDFPEFGGVRATNHRSLLPTGETIQFILAGTNIEDRLKVQQYFEEEHFFFKQGILWLEPVKEGEPKMSGRIILAQDWIDKILFDKETAPRFGLDFPAKKLLPVWIGTM